MSKHPKPGSDKPHSQPNDSSAQNQKRTITGDVHVRGEVFFEAGPEEKLSRQAADRKQDSKDWEKKWLERGTLAIVTLYAGLTAIQSCQSINSVRIAKDSLESVQRAFIFPTPVTEPVYDTDGKTKTGERIMIRWENSGTTPTKNMTI